MAGSLRYLGHSTVLIELDGVRLLTDPMLRWRTAHLRRTARGDVQELRGIDAVLLSHGHFDHFDVPSLERVGRGVRVVLPRGLGGVLRRRRFEQVVEVVTGDEVAVGTVTVAATKADHEGGRPPFRQAEALGYAIVGSLSIYFAGDTDLFDEMDGLVPGLDLALIPIWGWGPTLGRGGHLDPDRAAEAVRRLRPRVVVPIHWGTYAPVHKTLFGLPRFLTEPPNVFSKAVARVAPDVEVRVLAPGEETELPAPGVPALPEAP
jgi:L-ascorbate metabolism protein UlaG (beta-lactamase superfamily)